mmetsp:Transcript_3047/g.7603  ORF Transcript_3047/g.7603 Transcript_3047/m.7603 type:complete len:258 (+) Transcript_3047:360-1133(+)
MIFVILQRSRPSASFTAHTDIHTHKKKTEQDNRRNRPPHRPGSPPRSRLSPSSPSTPPARRPSQRDLAILRERGAHVRPPPPPPPRRAIRVSILPAIESLREVGGQGPQLRVLFVLGLARVPCLLEVHERLGELVLERAHALLQRAPHLLVLHPLPLDEEQPKVLGLLAQRGEALLLLLGEQQHLLLQPRVGLLQALVHHHGHVDLRPPPPLLRRDERRAGRQQAGVTRPVREDRGERRRLVGGLPSLGRGAHDVPE